MVVLGRVFDPGSLWDSSCDWNKFIGYPNNGALARVTWLGLSSSEREEIRDADSLAPGILDY